MTKLKTQPWTVENGKARMLDGRWLTPIQLLRKVKSYILKHPKRYCQSDTVVKTDCGTVACIAGWMCLLTTGSEQAFGRTVGQFLMGRSEWPWLFDATFWPSKRFIDKLEAAKTYKERAAVAAEAIEYYIKHDLRDGEKAKA